MGQWRAWAEKAYEALNRGEINLDGLDENVEWIDPGLPEPLHGLPAVRAYMQGFFKAFPDARLTIRDGIETDRMVVLEVTLTGTHLGPLPMGSIPPTGKNVSIDSCQVAKIRGDKIVHCRVYVDNLQLLAQLGLMPVPAATP